MKTFRFIYLAVIAVLISSCQAEIWEPASQQLVDNFNSFELAISSNDMIALNPVTKAQDENLNPILSQINDLNIRIDKGSNQYDYVYCTSEGISINGNTLAPENNTKYIDGNSVAAFSQKKVVKIHFDGIKSSEVKNIEVIANHGSDLNGVDWATVKDDAVFTPGTTSCKMYGSSNTAQDNLHGSNPTPCKLYDIKLKRSRAMVSVKLKDNGLKEGVAITPLSIRFVNVPKSCKMVDLGKNKITSISDTSSIERQLDWGVLKGTSTARKDSLGRHNFDFGPSIDMSNMSDMSYFFFLFENMQGNSTVPGTSPATKYPDDLKSSNLDPDKAIAESIANARDRQKNYKATYLELKCDYKQRDNAGEVKVGGTIIYRLFLGSDIVQNFDVEGNSYYRIDLNLKNYGGAKEDGKTDAQGNLVVNDADLSWRVDMDTKAWGFEKDQFDFDSHYIDGAVKVIGSNWKFSQVIQGDANASWLTINIKPRNNETWVNPTTIVEQHCQLNIENGELKFNIQPMSYASKEALDPEGQFNENTYKQHVNYREMQLEVMNLDTQKKDTIIVRQYAPIPIFSDDNETSLIGFMERFEEYPTDQQTGKTVIGYPWKWEGDKLTQTFTNPADGQMTYKYTFGLNPSTTQAAENTVNLSKKYTSWGDLLTPEGEGSAADRCYIKSSSGVKQGAAVGAYILPSKTMFERMLVKAEAYVDTWGPFEPLHKYEDYWTQSVQPKSLNSVYYKGGDKPTYPEDGDRSLSKRIRSVYVDHTKYKPFGKPDPNADD